MNFTASMAHYNITCNKFPARLFSTYFSSIMDRPPYVTNYITGTLKGFWQNNCFKLIAAPHVSPPVASINNCAILHARARIIFLLFNLFLFAITIVKLEFYRKIENRNLWRWKFPLYDFCFFSSVDCLQITLCILSSSVILIAFFLICGSFHKIHEIERCDSNMCHCTNTP